MHMTHKALSILAISVALASAACQPQRISTSDHRDKPAASQAENPVDVHLTISSAGAYALDGEPVAREDLEKRLVALSQATPKPVMHIQPDVHAPYEAVAFVLETERKAGIDIPLGIIGGTQ